MEQVISKPDTKNGGNEVMDLQIRHINVKQLKKI